MRADPGLDLTLHQSMEGDRLARLRARGYAMHDIEDVASTPAPVSVKEPVVEPQPGLVPSESHPRLLAQWQPRAWIALCRRVSGPSVEIVQTVNGPVVDNHGPLWLCALWPPQRVDMPLHGRWPEALALLTAESCSQALIPLLGRLPEDARIWHANLEADWVLLVDLALHQQPGLRPQQLEQLRELQQREREQAFTRLNQAYESRDGLVWRRP